MLVYGELPWLARAVFAEPGFHSDIVFWIRNKAFPCVTEDMIGNMWLAYAI